jgi:hypothetical protein
MASQVLDHRAMRFERAQTRLLEPFAICGILVGFATIALRILVAFANLPKGTILVLFKGSIVLAALVAIVYSVFSLSDKLKGPFADRMLYVVVVGIFAGIIVGTLVLM